MEKILFVIPGLKTGGTNTSLEHLYDLIKDYYDITIVTLSTIPYKRYSFEPVLKKAGWLISLYYADYADSKGFVKIPLFLIKVLKRICLFLHIDFERFVKQREAGKLEKKLTPNIIIAFEEGYATSFVSYFRSHHKLAWIHCDYAKTYGNDDSKELIYAGYEKIVCVSQYTANGFNKLFPALSDKVTYFYNVMDEKSILQKSSENVKDIFVDSDVFTILSVGRLSPVKRFPLIPEIAYELSKKRKNFRWYIIGGGSEEEMQKIKANIVKYDMGSYVYPLGYKYNPYPYFKVANLYVCTSESEACPMVFKEARVFSLPIVSTDFPSAKEFIEDGENGFVSCIESIAEKIAEAMNKCWNVNNDEIDKTSSLFNKLINE